MRTKDLQVAAWLTEGLLHRDGFGGLASGLQLTTQLLDTFWDTVFPELDGQDADFRAAPLNWIGTQLTLGIQRVPINAAGHDFLQYQDALDTSHQGGGGIRFGKGASPPGGPAHSGRTPRPVSRPRPKRGTRIY